MSSSNLISASQLTMQMSPSNRQYKKVVWHNNLQLSVRPFLPVEEMLEAVHGIVETVFQTTDLTGGFCAVELFDFAIRAAIVSYYAAVELPDTLEKQYELLYTTDLYETVCKHINQGQL